MPRRSTGIPLLVVSCLHAHAIARAQAPVRAGTEFQINTKTLNQQITAVNRSIDFESNGDFVVVWASDFQDGSLEGVFGQRFASSGARLGAEFRVNSFTLNSQDYAAVALDADGDFVVAWRSLASTAPSVESPLAASTRRASRREATSCQHLHDRRAESPPWPATPTATSSSPGRARARTAPVSASSPAASTRRAWRRAARSRSTRSPPAIAQSGDRPRPERRLRRHLAEHGQDGNDYGVFAQRFNSLGARQGPEFQVNTYITGSSVAPPWGSTPTATSSSSGRATARAEPFSASSRAASTARNASGHRDADRHLRHGIPGSRPSIGVDADGDFVVTWQS